MIMHMVKKWKAIIKILIMGGTKQLGGVAFGKIEEAYHSKR